MIIVEYEPDNIGELIRELRLDAQMSQAELAKAAGVTQTTISWYESGLQSPNLEKLIKIFRVFHVDEVRLNTMRRTNDVNE